MRLSARGAQKTRDASRKLLMYSKQWTPGDTLRVFYPIYWEEGRPEIAVGAIWGHSVTDIKALGLKTAFIPSTTDFDENKLPIGQPDITYQFSKIARVFVNGQKAAEEANIERKRWPTEAARKDALKELENKFDAQNNRQAVRPIIGPVQYYISTEVVSVKVANEVPVMDSVVLSSSPLSNSIIRKLYTLMEDPKYAPSEGDTYFEVEWKYPADSDKGASSKAAVPNGLTLEYRFQTMYPDKFNSITGMMEGIVFDAESIARRATRSIDPMKVQQALQQYAFLNSEYLDLANKDDIEVLKNNIEVLSKLEIVTGLVNTELVEELKAALAEYNDVKDKEQQEFIPNPELAESSIPEFTSVSVEQSMSEIPEDSINPEAPKLDDLLIHKEEDADIMAGMLNGLVGGSAQIDDDVIGNIDLTSVV